MAVHTIPLYLSARTHLVLSRCPRTPELHEGISLDTGYQLSLSWPEVYTRRESNPRPGKISVLTPLCHLSYACAPEGLSICTPDIRSDPFETHCSLSIRGSTCLRKCWASSPHAHISILRIGRRISNPLLSSQLDCARFSPKDHPKEIYRR